MNKEYKMYKKDIYCLLFIHLLYENYVNIVVFINLFTLN